MFLHWTINTSHNFGDMKIANPAGNLGMQDFCEFLTFFGVEWINISIWDDLGWVFFGDFHRELGEGLVCLVLKVLPLVLSILFFLGLGPMFISFCKEGMAVGVDTVLFPPSCFRVPPYALELTGSPFSTLAGFEGMSDCMFRWKGRHVC